MKVIFSGSFITGGSGKLGGTVVQGGPYGPIARNGFRPKVRNINNAFQPCEKEAFTNVAKLWRVLTAPQVALWNAYAIAPLTGYATFLKFNLQYYRINGTYLVTPVTLPVVPASIVLNSCTRSSPNQFTLNYTGTLSVNTNYLHIFVSLNNSFGAVRCVKSRLRLVNTTILVTGGNIYTFVNTVHNVSGLAGCSQFVGVRLFDTVTGYLTPVQIIQFNS
jgi:hypothetical protein